MIIANTIKSLKTETLVTLYNKLTGKQTKKFSSRAKGEAQVIGAAKVASTEVVFNYLRELGVQVKENPYSSKESESPTRVSPVSATGDKRVATIANAIDLSVADNSPPTSEGERVVKTVHSGLEGYYQKLETARGPSSAPKRTRKRKGTNLAAPPGAPVPCREGSKQALLLEELSRPEGVTMTSLIKALSGGRRPWREQTVRAGFGWDMKLKGYGVRSAFDPDGVERFFIVVPEGHSIPAHRPLKSK